MFDLFNKKKVADLQRQLSHIQDLYVNEQTKFTKLNNAVKEMYSSLTDYFVSRYKGKYFNVALETEKQSYNYNVRCDSVQFTGGLLEFEFAQFNNPEKIRMQLTLDCLKGISLISKKMWKGDAQ